MSMQNEPMSKDHQFLKTVEEFCLLFFTFEERGFAELYTSCMHICGKIQELQVITLDHILFLFLLFLVRQAGVSGRFRK